MVFLKALVEVKILEHLRERDLESTSNVPFGGEMYMGLLVGWGRLLNDI